MGTRTAKGGKAALAGVQSRAQHPRGYDAIEDENLADTTALRLALTATERRFAAALRQLEGMRRRDALLEQQVALLEERAAKAQRFAYHDELTGLPNRHLLLDRFHQATALAARHDTHVVLLFLDLDGFKRINDMLGHSAGDKLLQQIAVRLVGCIRTSDTACRYGGDEFVVLLSELNGKEGAAVVTNNIRAHLGAPYIIDGAAITMSISLGTAVYPVDAHACDELIQLADLVMYRHKARCSATPSIVDGTVDNGTQNGRVFSVLGAGAGGP
jgi:diguanylate cyclase (GGDEF)-like protein